MMKQVNAAGPTQVQSGEEASAAVNHRQRMVAEQQRRAELGLMAKEDYTGTPEGQERLQRQEERSRMREEELLVLRLVEREKEAARKLQREKELEEEKKIKEQYLAKIREQREQQEKEAREKEAARKLEMERKMKALKEAADAKARAEFAAKQHAIEEEARIAREIHQIEVEKVQMQVEDVLGHAMQQEMIAERERQRQIAAEQEEWRLFQEREQEKQREATQLRRAAMAQQYEQDKQRRIQIHKLQKEREAQQAERKEMQIRQSLERQKMEELELKNEVEDEKDKSEVGSSDNTLREELQNEKEPLVDSGEPLDQVTSDNGDQTMGGEETKAVESQEVPVIEQVVDNEILAEEEATSPELLDGVVEAEGPRASDIPDSTSSAEFSDETNANPDLDDAKDETIGAEEADEEVVVVPSPRSVDGPAIEEPLDSSEKREDKRPVWSISSAVDCGLVSFAQVLSVTDNSPAFQATLLSGDLLVDFGGIVSSTPKCLMAMAECVQKNVNTCISVVLLRPVDVGKFQEVHVSLCPRKWEGKGLLGCQLSPFKWSQDEIDPGNPCKTMEKDETQETTEVSASEDGASALVIYDIVPASSADQSGLVNGDILAGIQGLDIPVNITNLSVVVGHIQSLRTACAPIQLDINRWIDEDQCYRSLHLELSSEGADSLGFSMTSFVEYYNYSSSASACEECYYTSLTTALHAAALSGHVNCLEALLNSLQNGDGGGYSASDYLDWRDEDGRTPLFYACYAGQVECVQYLLNTTESVSNEQPFGVDLYGDTVLHAATTSGNLEVISLLLESGGVKIDDRNQSRLTCAHISPSVDTLAFLGDNCEADLLATDSEERMPLAYACLRNDIDSIRYLCKKHPDFVDYADVRGNTPLHVAAWLGFQQAAEVLITFLPSIALFITNEDGQNAADLARSSGMEDVAAFLDSIIAAADSNVS
ncbi:Serine/threonine-protein phosphatase 6 regulatory ankyrin repeat subunit A [Phytophthora citrophthora]|uniref:Serine/threonine-protein phosphatase 6 regulatory ankyrin repeat subunit A n=1 Tax=Phytophthora citrophthora TaxID=4793 RepID=A0AAD9LJR3_9STRA|nr:Serine/threonine-protein phosphatase 6 regulatory ankyrin repeat subunit A [Phytophthora citrophthora]